MAFDYPTLQEAKLGGRFVFDPFVGISALLPGFWAAGLVLHASKVASGVDAPFYRASSA
jgi:hypothetical protein